MSRKIALWQVVLIVCLALVAGTLPLLIGVLLGSAAFVVTPVVMAFVLVWLGGAVARMVPAARWRGVALAALVLATAFVGAPIAAERLMNGPRATMYVVVHADEFATFTQTLAALVKARGGESGLGESGTDEPKTTTHRLDANIGWIDISAHGTLMERNEHYPCSGRTDYTVVVRPYLSFAGNPEPVLDELKRELLARGYEVRDQPFRCDVPRPVR